MYRLLIIGGPAPRWAEALGRLVGNHVDIDTARLPSAGIRQFESTPADLVVIADDKGGSRIEILAQAIHERPLGQLVPLLIIAPELDDRDEKPPIEGLTLAGWHAPTTPPSEIIATMEAVLGDDLCDADGADDSQAPEAAAPDAVEGGSASYFDGDLVLEPMDEDSTSHQQVSRNSIFRAPGPGSKTDPTGVDADAIERKLKAVRHEDYYVILDVRRGAESQTVREAFHRLFERFDPESLDFALVRQYQDQLDEIRDALEDAFAVLGDPDLRQSYLEHTVKR